MRGAAGFNLDEDSEHDHHDDCDTDAAPAAPAATATAGDSSSDDDDEDCKEEDVIAKLLAVFDAEDDALKDGDEVAAAADCGGIDGDDGSSAAGSDVDGADDCDTKVKVVDHAVDDDLPGGSLSASAESTSLIEMLGKITDVSAIKDTFNIQVNARWEILFKRNADRPSGMTTDPRFDPFIGRITCVGGKMVQAQCFRHKDQNCRCTCQWDSSTSLTVIEAHLIKWLLLGLTSDSTFEDHQRTAKDVQSAFSKGAKKAKLTSK